MSGNSSVVKRAILQAFYPSTQTADVLILEATSAFLTGIPINNGIATNEAVVGALCAVLFIDEHNPNDCVVIAVYPNGSQGVPSSLHGLVSFITPVGTTNFLVTSGGTVTQNTGAPAGATGVLLNAYFTSASAGAWIVFTKHSASFTGGFTIGNLPTANGFLNGFGIVPVDANGQIDVGANVANCTVSFYVIGYVS